MVGLEVLHTLNQAQSTPGFQCGRIPDQGRYIVSYVELVFWFDSINQGSVLPR